MLESFGYPATFFIVSDAVVRREEFWWDQLECIFHAQGFDYVTATRLLTNYAMNGLVGPFAGTRRLPPSSGSGGSFTTFRPKNDAGILMNSASGFP